MKKICFVTAARSEYGLLKWLMKDIEKSKEFKLQLVVTGGHLSYDQGHTVDQIIDDGFNIEYMVDSQLDTSSPARIAESMGRMATGIAGALDMLQPDYLLVLGDRYELLPICNTAFVMRIPIIHISGGDVTEGAIDNGVRNAITMLADYHFSGTKESMNNIIRMRGSNKNVWNVGEPGLDAFYREKLLNRKELSEDLAIDFDKRWVLMTYHAETLEDLSYNLENVRNIINRLICEKNLHVIITYANADFGGKEINEYIEKQALLYPDKIKVIPSLGHFRYLSFLRQVTFVIGNSSSGIVEAPFMGIPVINIGNRQKGRYQCGNVIQCDSDKKSISEAVSKALNSKRIEHNDLNYWGNGHCNEKVIEILKKTLA